MKVQPIPPEDRLAAEAEGWRDAPLLIVTVRATTGEQRVQELVGVSETAWRRAEPREKATILRRLAESFDRICATAESIRRRESHPYAHSTRQHEGSAT